MLKIETKAGFFFYNTHFPLAFSKIDLAVLNMDFKFFNTKIFAYVVYTHMLCVYICICTLIYMSVYM